MVLNPNTAVDPRAVVIESFHTTIANVAMSAARGADYLALWAQVVAIKLLYTFEEINGRVFLKITWVSHPRNKEEGYGNSKA